MIHFNRLLYVAVASGFLILLPTCKSRTSTLETSKVVGPSIMVYRLNGPLEGFVPVGLNEEKTAIVSYPSPLDLGRMKSPINVEQDWWIDTRGITQNTGFLSIKTADYLNLKEAPSLAEMMQNLNKTPFLELWNCGISQTGFTDAELIKKKLKRNQLKGCTCLIKNTSP